MANKVVSITADMYSLVEKFKREGQVSKQYITKTPNASRTFKALLKYNFVEPVDKNWTGFKLTLTGEELAHLTPRFSGTAKDDAGRPIETWSVNLDEAGHPTNQAEKKHLREHPDKETITDPRTLDEIIEQRENPTSSLRTSKLLRRADDRGFMTEDYRLESAGPNDSELVKELSVGTQWGIAEGRMLNLTTEGADDHMVHFLVKNRHTVVAMGYIQNGRLAAFDKNDLPMRSGNPILEKFKELLHL